MFALNVLLAVIKLSLISVYRSNCFKSHKDNARNHRSVQGWNRKIFELKLVFSTIYV